MPMPPVPAERKRARGNPGKRALPKSAEVVAIAPASVEAPAELGEAGADAWVRIMGTARAWLANSDYDLLMQFCEKADRRAQMLQKLENSDYILLTDKGYAYANPIVGMISTIETEMVKIMSLLGLTPTDRTRLGLAEVKAQSTLEKLREQRKAQ